MIGGQAENSTTRADRPAIAYVGSPLPLRSQTFVYRELLGLRGRGWRVIPITVGAPGTGDDELDRLAAEAVQVYAPPTFLMLVPALLLQPLQAVRALRDALIADLTGPMARLKFLFQAWMGLATAWRLRKQGIGHVHAHLANVPATVGLYIARGLGAGFSFTGHAADLFVYRGALAFKLAQADFVSSISHWHQGFYDGIVPAPREDRPVIRCSVELPAAIRPEGNDIVAVGRLVSKKGFDLLVRAFARLNRPDLHLTIAGGGEEQDALLALAKAEGVADRIAFLGSTPHAECLELIRNARLFAIPCRTSSTGDRDGIPVVLMEAMAAGRPVIAGRLESIAELVEDGVSGLLVPPDDVDALATALAHLVDDADMRRRMGLAGRARVEEEFSDAINWDRLEAAIDRAYTGEKTR
jgi:glycosyltransferase involved in cell wall biosynthesis